MELLRVTVKHNNKLIGDKIKVADTFLARFRGLMMRPGLEEGEGLLISPCNSIHMMFMRFPIDAIFLDAGNQIKALYRKLSPWIGFSSLHRDVTSVLELKAGMIDNSGVKIDDILIMERIRC
jgi:uncharacterized membrane protein (UPF0127 family)